MEAISNSGEPLRRANSPLPLPADALFRARPSKVRIDPSTAAVRPQTIRAEWRLRDMRTSFGSATGAEPAGTLIYASSIAALANDDGHVGVCVTRIESGAVGGEFFMSLARMHFEAEGEAYLCQSGVGGVLLSNEEEVLWIRLQAGDICYIPPRWEHRAVNTGPVPFVFASFYSALSAPLREPVRRGTLRARVLRSADGFSVRNDDGVLVDRGD